jgi:hypothetical protein
MQLDDEMQGIYTSIQALVSSIRIGDGMSVIKGHINEISSLVGKVAGTVEAASNQHSGNTLRIKVEPVLQNLAANRKRLLDAAAEGARIRDPAAFKEFTNELPPLAFDIVQETKVSHTEKCSANTINITLHRNWFEELMT